MATKKKKKNIRHVDKKAAAEKEQLSSDSAIGWVFVLIMLTALIVLTLVLTVGASNAKNKASAEQTETETMPADAEAFEAFESEGQQSSESLLYADINVKDYGTITVQLQRRILRQRLG